MSAQSEEAPSKEAATLGLIRWADKLAGRYGDCDPDDQIRGSIAMALAWAWRTHAPDRGPFEPYAKSAIRKAMNAAIANGGLKGHRRRHEAGEMRPDQPPVAQLSALSPDERDRLLSGDPPVGWDVDYEDFVESLAGSLPESHGRVVRMTYLDCRGVGQRSAASHLGISRPWFAELHTEAIRRIKTRFGVEPDSVRPAKRGKRRLANRASTVA